LILKIKLQNIIDSHLIVSLLYNYISAPHKNDIAK